jgi:hypothetical protein
MNRGKNNYKYLFAAALTSMLLTVPSAKATGSFQPVQCINMQSATFSVPSPAQVVSPPTIPVQLFDVGQKSSVPVTIDAVWTPTADGASGILEFLADGQQPQCQSCYCLQISPSQVSISLVQGGVATGLGTAPVATSTGVPFHFQLVENNGVFTVVNPATNATLLTVSDSTITSNPALCFGTDIQGTWSFSAMQNKTSGTPPVLPNNVVASAPDPGANNDNGQTLSKVTHIGYPSMGSMTVTLTMTSMVAPPSTPIGHITSHRQYGTSFGADDYSVFLFADHVSIGKTVQGTFYGQATGKYPSAVQTPIVANETVPLQISTEDNSNGSVTISVVYPPTNKLIAQWTDTGWSPTTATPVPPYTYGFQFGIYTDLNSAVCWNNVLMYPQ